MSEQNTLSLEETGSLESVAKYKFEPIKGYPMLNWHGKRPFTSTQYYPAQKKEIYGEEVNGWINKIFWGDNLQVMSHLLKEYRGKVNLIYIDPPFDSKADYKRTVSLKGKSVKNDQTTFEDKQYSDIWNNDEYLQFIYERIIILRELLSVDGFIFIHCDWHKSHHIRIIMDEVFGSNNFRNEIIWVRSTNPKGSQYDSQKFSTYTDTIYVYAKSDNAVLKLDKIRKPLTSEEVLDKYNRKDEIGIFYDGPMVRSSTMGERPNLVYEYKGYTPPSCGWRVKKSVLIEIDKKGNLGWSNTGAPYRKLRPEDDKGKPIGNLWDDISLINSQAEERVGYPTQKPIDLLKRVIECASKENDLILDCFMGSGTSLVAALQLNRRFIGSDINLGAVQITSKRLNSYLHSNDLFTVSTSRPGFEVLNVNNYEIFRNPIEAKGLLLEALEIEETDGTSYDGEKDGYMVKVMPVNRIATREDLNDLISNFPYKVFEQRKETSPTKPVESIMLICMGHEPDLKAHLEQECGYKLDVKVVDILRDKSNIEFKRDSEAEINIVDGRLKVSNFYPLNLMQKLSLQKESVSDWKALVETIVIDWNYDGSAMEPAVVDIPGKNEFVAGVYSVPKDAGTIKIKITDLLSESYEELIQHG
tara:strand:+ start:15901 stop:17826 length:1926 start_codon:yes stop_codon:yes gene_type:complete